MFDAPLPEEPKLSPLTRAAVASDLPRKLEAMIRGHAPAWLVAREREAQKRGCTMVRRRQTREWVEVVVDRERYALACAIPVRKAAMGYIKRDGGAA
jgi:hypothetical protein